MINIKNKDYIKAFGKNIQKLRKEARLTQEELANDSDIPLSQIGRIERGEVNTTISTLYVIAKALDVKPENLLDFQED